jgi:hypothetical protein
MERCSEQESEQELVGVTGLEPGTSTVSWL